MTEKKILFTILIKGFENLSQIKKQTNKQNYFTEIITLIPVKCWSDNYC